MTTMGCDIVTAAYEDEDFDGSDFSSSSACSSAPSPPSLSEVMHGLAVARTRAREALFIGKDWTDELSFSLYYHQHWANQVLHLTSLAALYFALLWAAAEHHFVLPAAIAVTISASYTAIDVPLGGAFLVGLGVLAGAATALVVTIGREGHEAKRGVWIVCWALSQLAGHVVFEGRLPAFRPAEALVVTPALMVLLVLFRTGWGETWAAPIRDRKNRWKGTEKFTWPSKGKAADKTVAETE
ncbi:hypothetical protein MMPV_004523 [Pyropia vietnamensis]